MNLLAWLARVRKPALPALLRALCVVAASAGCHRSDERGGATAAAESPPTKLGLSPGDGPSPTDPGPLSAAPETRRAFAVNFQTSILSDTEWPPDIEEPDTRKGRKAKRRHPKNADANAGSHSRRIGYLRHGSSADVIAAPIVNEACPEGWYELLAGGFVCGKAIVFDEKNPRVAYAPRPPRDDAPLPYVYGAITVQGTPLYKRVLSAADRAAVEAEAVAKSRSPGASKPPAEVSAPVPVPVTAPAPSPPEATDVADDGRDDDSSVSRANPEKHEPLAQKVHLTLRELKGRGPVVRRMARGFILALDKEFRAADTKWWRTTAGFAVASDRVFPLLPVAEPHGMFLPGRSVADATEARSNATADAGVAGRNDGGGDVAPSGEADRGVTAADAGPADLRDFGVLSGDGTVAFLRGKDIPTYRAAKDAKQFTWGKEAAGLFAVEFTGTARPYGGSLLKETTAGFWLRTPDARAVTPQPPNDLAPGEKWIDVDLAGQTLVAFEGMHPVFAARVSTGRSNPVDKERDYKTPPGNYRIREKHITATMDGDIASDGPYSIEDVPWVMYFEGSYALHGAFWHNQFGYPHSHGCVNMAPADARALFSWVQPHLPPGWHGVYGTDSEPGTRVIIH